MAATRTLLTIAHSYVVALNRQLAHHLQLAGGGRWEVTAVSPRYFHGSRDLRPVRLRRRDDEPIRLESIPAYFTQSVHGFLYGRRLSEILSRDWSLVHCWEEPFVLAGGQVAWLTPSDVPLVYATFQNLPKRYPPPFRQIEQFAMRRAAGWIAFGHTIDQALRGREIYRDRPARTIPPGVDVKLFHPDAGGEETRRQLGWIESGPPVVGYLGRFVPEKGLRLLMAALDRARSPWRALLVGAGPMEVEIRRWASRHGDRARVCTGVHHEDVPRHLCAMDLLCAPSQTTRRWREQFGRMLIEAFACGVPVIGSNSGEIPHVIGEAGLILPQRDEIAWSAAIDDLLESPAKRIEMRDRGLHRAQTEFAWPVIARRHLEFFDELVEARSTTRVPFALAPFTAQSERLNVTRASCPCEVLGTGETPVSQGDVPADLKTTFGDDSRSGAASSIPLAARTPPRRLLSIAHSYGVAMNRRLLDEMGNAGGDRWEVTAVAPDYFHGVRDLRPVRFEARDNESLRVEVVPTHLSRFVHIFYYGQKLKRVLNENWDFVHCWEEPYIHVGWQIARWTRRGTPLVYRTAQSIDKSYPPPFAAMERYNLERSAGWICSGTLVRDMLMTKPMYARRPMRLIPLGVDLNAFHPDPHAGAAVRRSLGWDESGPPVVGYLGRFVRDKGLNLMMDALDGLTTPWRALFVGAGPAESELRAWARNKGDCVRIRTDVRHAAVPAHLCAMDVMCAPSLTTPHWREQFGRMLIEAFACGVPVIGSDSGEIPFVIDNAGVICSEHDTAGWTQQIGALLDDPRRRAELAAIGLERARRLYAWPVVGRAYIEFFDQILQGRTFPPAGTA